MRRAAVTLVQATLAGGWVLLAFHSGGYGDTARLAALAVAAVALAVAAIAAPAPLPQASAARIALGGLAGLTAWTAISRAWSPLADAAGDALERDLLYVCALTAGALVWHARGAARQVEPLLLAGVVVVVGAGLAGRLVPGLVPQHPSISAGGRLEQPLTYWNAMGALAGIGVVVAARIAGDRARGIAVRCLAAAAAPALAMGVVLSFSRGALVATAGGLLVLLVLAPSWTQLRAAAICLEAGALASLAALASPAVKELAGGARERQGALVLLALLAAAALAAAATWWAARCERDASVRLGRLPLPRHAAPLAGVLCVLALTVPILAGGRDAGRTPVARGTSAAQLASVRSNRYDYWRVGLDAFAAAPLQGTGAGGFRAEWLRHRPYPEGAREAHSLEVQVLCDLGLPGAVLLLLLLGGVAACARRVQRDDPALASGGAAVLVVWLMHASIDWDWEMPALTLAALLPAGMLLARAGARDGA